MVSQPRAGDCVFPAPKVTLVVTVGIEPGHHIQGAVITRAGSEGAGARRREGFVPSGIELRQAFQTYSADRLPVGGDVYVTLPVWSLISGRAFALDGAIQTTNSAGIPHLAVKAYPSRG